MSDSLETIPTGIPRWLDAVIAGTALVLSAPLLAGIAVGVRLSSPGPALFRQTRVGRNGQTFELIKFRTMYVHDTSLLLTLRGDNRITRLGWWLRMLKLDELPQLLNVLRGEMSIVGPRPEVPKYVDSHDPTWRNVLQVRPGVTDPVTIRLRNEEVLLASVTGEPEKFYRDVLQPYKLRGYLDYLRHRSLTSDVLVIYQTMLVVFHPAAAPPPSLDELGAPRQLTNVQ